MTGMAGERGQAGGGDLVTGALGFVGLHLVRALLIDGRSVAGLGRQPGGAPSPDATGGFARCAGGGRGALRYEGPAGAFAYHEASLQDGPALAAAIGAARPRVIYHLAAQSSAAASFDDPRDTFASNVLGTLCLLEAVRALPAAERPIVVVAGSAEEYGPRPPDSPPLVEDSPPAPVSPYAASKAAQTLLCQQYHRTWNLPVVVARPFAQTGPGQQPRFAFASFARQIAAAEAGQGPAEVVTGDLSPIRDYLHVRDAVAAYRALAARGRPGEIYNICSGTALTMAEGLRILVAAARVPVAVRRDPSRNRPADTPRLVGDNRKLRAETGWKPVSDARTALLDLLDEARKEFA
ncbi:NAD-dependent epimerase/dehydratase family protein [bacterium]|nr:NAD-dependent epimerase/dehydratase family protein [bacterium]